MKKFFDKIRALDVLIFTIILAFIISTSLFIYSSDSSVLYLSVKTPKGDWVYPMGEDIEFMVEGRIGLVNIKIEKGEAFVVNSSCTNKTCVLSSRLKNHGDWNACLPNKVFLSVEKK